MEPSLSKAHCVPCLRLPLLLLLLLLMNALPQRPRRPDYSKVFMKEAKQYIEAGDPVAVSSSSEDDQEQEPKPPTPKMDPVVR